MEKDKIVTTLKNIVARMGLNLKEVEVSEIAGHTLFTLHSTDSGALIGAGGDTLHALNHVVKKSLEKELRGDKPFRFVVDVNGYHLKHIKMLESQARMLAERARTFKYDIDMSPMSPYDRLIVHASLQGLPDIATESKGEGVLRHIVIKYTGESQKAEDTVV